jgi:hypothetical protein
MQEVPCSRARGKGRFFMLDDLALTELAADITRARKDDES